MRSWVDDGGVVIVGDIGIWCVDFGARLIGVGLGCYSEFGSK